MAIGESLSILSSILSIAASVKELMASHGATAGAAVDQLSGSDGLAREILADPDTREAVLLLAQTVISNDLLDQLTREARKCERNHIGDRKKAKGHTDKDDADIEAAQCMCSVLRDTKRYNGGSLPDSKLLNDYWKSYRCRD